MDENNIDNKERGYTIKHIFDATRERVWRAWTEPDQFAQWFGLADSTLTDVEMDVRPNGAWKANMHIPDGTVIPWSGIYLEADKPNKLVMTFSDQKLPDGEYEMFTVTLADMDDKTEITLRQSGGHLPDAEYVRAKEGTGKFLDRMAELVAKT